jgi:hypothetical protein
LQWLLYALVVGSFIYFTNGAAEWVIKHV